MKLLFFVGFWIFSAAVPLKDEQKEILPPPIVAAVSGSLADRINAEISSFRCQLYDPNVCNPAAEPCDLVQTCEDHRGTTPGCFSLWTNTSTEGVKVLNKGCWNTPLDCRKNECIATAPSSRASDPRETFFCCCLTSDCNSRMFYSPELIVKTTERVDIPAEPSDRWLSAVLYAFLPVCLLSLIIFGGYWCYRRHRYAEFIKSQLQPLPQANGKTPPSLLSFGGPLRPIKLLEIKAKGRFGCVYSAKWADRIVAVKTFPPQDEESWLREQEIYAVAGMRRHPNILEFFAAEVRGAGPEMECWLITAYHDNGSLYDYLKTHTLDLGQSLHMAITMLRGLAFLHEERIDSDGVYKPTIAHRDFKSRNVLIKQDLTACIADFGLSIKCEHDQTPNDTRGQVGTHRYMAPEVLEGATEFSPFAFRAIDVYAGGLVLWEILSRTCVGVAVDDYKMPYEVEVGTQPRVEAVQQCVVTLRKRPLLQLVWHSHPLLSVVCSTLEEMWDPEPEARITAGCAVERLAALSFGIKSSVVAPAPTATEPESTPLLVENGRIPSSIAVAS